jgi:hypothetical protein
MKCSRRDRKCKTLEENLDAIEGASGYVRVQWNNIKGSVLDTVSDLVGMLGWRARKPWITREMISKTDDRRKQKNINNEKEGRIQKNETN